MANPLPNSAKDVSNRLPDEPAAASMYRQLTLTSGRWTLADPSDLA